MSAAAAAVNDLTHARSILAKAVVTGEDRGWLERTFQRAERDGDRVLIGVIRAIWDGLAERERQEIQEVSTRAILRAEEQRRAAIESRRQRWRALTPEVRTAHMLYAERRDAASAAILGFFERLARGAEEPVGEPPAHFEPSGV